MVKIPYFLNPPRIIEDYFNRADETALKSPWRKIAGYDTGITSNVVTRPATGGDTMYVNDLIPLWTQDQWAEMRIVDGATQTDIGPIVRMQIIGGGEYGYVFNAYTGQPGIWRLNASAWTNLATSAQPVNGDIIRIEVRSNRISAYINNRLAATVNDDDHAYGQPGFHHYEAACQWDNYRAGALTPNNPFLLNKASSGITIQVGNYTFTIAGLSHTDLNRSFYISNVVPSTLYEGLTNITVYGLGFGASQGNTKIYVDEMEQNVQSWQDHTIVFNYVNPAGWASPRNVIVKKIP